MRDILSIKIFVKQLSSIYVPRIPTLIPCIPTLIPHIPTLIPHVPTLIPRVSILITCGPINSLIPFPGCPFRPLQIAYFFKKRIQILSVR